MFYMCITSTIAIRANRNVGLLHFTKINQNYTYCVFITPQFPQLFLDSNQILLKVFDITGTNIFFWKRKELATFISTWL